MRPSAAIGTASQGWSARDLPSHRISAAPKYPSVSTSVSLEAALDTTRRSRFSALAGTSSRQSGPVGLVGSAAGAAALLSFLYRRRRQTRLPRCAAPPQIGTRGGRGRAPPSRGGDRDRDREGGGKRRGASSRGPPQRRGRNDRDQSYGPGEQFTSPWTGKVYERWAPVGVNKEGEEAYKSSGLGAARAFETQTQRNIRLALDQGVKVPDEVEEYSPGSAEQEAPPARRKKLPARHALRAGSFSDIFNQLVLDTVIDLRTSKSETPIWFVETCGGEGEYHSSRLAKAGQAKAENLHLWPTAEDLFETLQDQDMTYMPPELKSWFDTMKFLNEPREELEVQSFTERNEASGSAEWLPSTTLVALRRLRPQDPVTIFEDHPVSFAALFNFVRNFSKQLSPHIELIFKDGFRMARNMFVLKKTKSEAHGRLGQQRGIVFADPSWSRGDEAYRCMDLVTRLWKHWRTATVMVAYPILPDHEHMTRKFLNSVRSKDRTLDLLTAEMYVNTPDWTPDSTERKWHGCGMLISLPPHTTAERIRAALNVMSQELSSQPGAAQIRVVVEKL
eukprot:CAMPEP_0170590940 /NCGR_PEP_ID=MMETSP0224-20130122/12136_1 /TAXON_ID=285029 /ORGANISM="Togula jolla, Strain CCCM 725" /LENGTH=561 /DNA_ID=CAMNT_0010914767 /DNA_START=104 /DNA_END=1789 /DNA_ORIENTATION=-